MKRILSLWMVLAFVLMLAGCGGGSQPSKAPAKAAGTPDSATKNTAPAPAVAPKETVTVKVGSTEKAALKNLPLFLTGFADAEGVKVEYVEFKGGAEVSKALLNGEIDMALTTVENVLKDKSGEFRLLAMVTNGPGQALLVDAQAKDSIKSVKDLVGKSVGVSSIGSGPHTTLLELLSANGIDPKTVQVVPVGLDPREALGTGKVVAMVTIEPFITIGIQTGKATILVDARKPEGIKAIYGSPEVPWISLISTTGFIQSKPESAQRMVSVVSKSLKFLSSNPGSTISAKVPAFFKDEVKGDEQIFVKMLEDNKATFSADGQFNLQSLTSFWKRLQTKGSVPKEKDFAMDQFSETKFLQNVK